ncbi:putative circadian clock protein, KaiC [Haladaptatus paucihalophilus DX253]|uniref:non-specific serine/threonine protein kinase n=2 Tax=Haladaptatus TaxID=367188 RepID=E7QR80_HALPU|nr:ATPase domain-containing protein [Haladaptatus paucihalophilus]EFW92988.1 putative circadian clock protein, KaiC [Haladaptatus paucihalophilus DX253]SHL17454.1 circadian clock protein KaiC [Haladaptatus paucihalophilus DX253]
MSDSNLTKISTGTPGLDEILRGGFIAERSYLLRGDPGTGKTILGMKYLTAGVESDETVLFVNLEESEDDIRDNASTLDIDLSNVHFLDLSPDSDVFVDEQSYDIFTPSEVEQEPLTQAITERVESIDPDRVFIDPLTRLRHLTSDEYQFRKQVIAFMHYLKEQGATVLFTSQHSDESSDDDLQYMTDGTIELEHSAYGRTISVPKFRGSSVNEGNHAMRITDGGIAVFPELNPANHSGEFELESISSGVPEVNQLLHGGFERGTITILSGPTGVGKTTVGTQFMKEAAGRGERSVMYMFEETLETFRERSENINIPVRRMEEQGSLSVEEMKPLDCSATEFAHRVRTDVEENDTSIVMIDGIDGYKLSLRDDDDRVLVRKLHTLCRYLKNMGITVILVDEIDTVTGEFQATEAGISYLADNIVFLRHLEVSGEMRKAIGVLKKRTSDFERMLREFQITEHGLKVGEPLTELSGVLSGSPELARERSESANE